MLEELRQCEVCPFRCKVNRLEGKIGKCGCNDKIKIALASLHYYEEPCISGKNGSGTVFFSNCNLNCLFCQNYKISQEGKGREVSIEELADIFLYQQKKLITGDIGSIYLLLYGIGRFLIEFLRNDYRGAVGFLSTSQFISVFIVALGVTLMVYHRKKNPVK